MATEEKMIPTNEKGEFVRKDSAFRNWVKADCSTEFTPEAGRYLLYGNFACPWVNRCIAAINLKGLEDAIELSITHPVWDKTKPDDDNDTHYGWAFSQSDVGTIVHPGSGREVSVSGLIPDPVHNVRYVRDIYNSRGYHGKYTVPILFDKKTDKIVNNESADILRMINGEFNAVAKNPDVDLYPAALRGEIDAVNEWVYASINNGVYRCGFAQAQEAYDEAEEELSGALDRVEDILSKSRYLCGSKLTEADIRLFMTLIRFDEVYSVYFKVNRRLIREYPNMFNYLLEIYQMPAVKRSVRIDHIKAHYFMSHPQLNAYGVIPRGPGLAYLDQPHDRATKFPVA